MIDERSLIKKLEKYKDLWKLADAYHTGIFHGLTYAIEKAYEETRVGEWIPCSERLPQGCDDAEIEVVVSLYEPYSETVIRESGFALFYPKNNMFRSVYGERLDITDIVIAWMPLPQPYKGE